MSCFSGNIEKLTEKNTYYRKVIYTSKELQLVLMAIPVGEEIGREKHAKLTQFIRIEKGKGIAVVGKKRIRLRAGSVLIIPSRRYHNVVNTGKKALKLYTIYSPPEHPRNRKERVKKLFSSQ